MSRMADLEARRRTLMARCEAQRIELAQRVAQLRSGAPGAAQTATGAGGGSARVRHPLAWVATLAGLTLLGRTRDVLTLLVWLRTALAIASRAAQIFGLVSALRTRSGSAAKERAPSGVKT